ncbi:MAG: PAS domain S-box protein [Pseudomonadota bacterium]
MSLRFRINLLITVMMVLFMLALGIVIVDDARRQIREEIAAGTKVTEQLLTTAVVYSSQFIPVTGSQRDIMQDFLRHLGRVRANEIRVYDDLQHLLYASPPFTYKAGRYAPDWFARLVEPKTTTVTIRIRGGTLLIVPDASRSTLDAWDDLRGLMWIALGFFVLLNALVSWLIGRSLRPVRTILGGLSEMGRGSFEVRLPDFALPEFSSISQTFNRIAGALEDSMAENRRLALAVRQSSDAVMIHDLKGNISYWNPAAERLFGYRADKIAGRSATLLAPPGKEAEVSEHLAMISRREFLEGFETQRMTEDGHLLEVALSAAPLIDPHNEQVIGGICGMRDITERKRAQQAERELQQNRQLAHIIQSHLEEERRNLARELHDELGQCITAIKTIGASVANRAKDVSPEIHASVQTIVSVAGHMYDVVHGIVRQLRPSALDNLGLTETLQDTVASWASRHPEIDFQLKLEGKLDDLGEAVNITVYRVVQECFTNIIRHASASRAEISLTCVPRGKNGEGSPEGDALELVIRDDGKGMIMSGELDSGHFGLIGMRERVQALNGRFAVESPPAGGVTVRVSLPILRIEAPVK